MFFMAKPLVSHTFLCPQLALTTMQLPTKYFEDFALFEVPDDSSRPGQPPFAGIVSTLNKHPALFSNKTEVKLSAAIHPWLTSRGLEFTSPGLESTGFLYDEMVASERKPISKLFVKKWVFNPQRLADMFRDTVALKIIYAQAQTDVKNKLIFPTADERADLRKLALEGNSKEVRHLFFFFFPFITPVFSYCYSLLS